MSAALVSAAGAPWPKDDPSLPPDHGALPAWDVAELPAPLPFGMRNALKVIGPGAGIAATRTAGRLLRRMLMDEFHVRARPASHFSAPISGGVLTARCRLTLHA